eukprot:7829049-Pyramimonas_sp.AAC.1
MARIKQAAQKRNAAGEASQRRKSAAMASGNGALADTMSRAADRRNTALEFDELVRKGKENSPAALGLLKKLETQWREDQQLRIIEEDQQLNPIKCVLYDPFEPFIQTARPFRLSHPSPCRPCVPT